MIVDTPPQRKSIVTDAVGTGMTVTEVVIRGLRRAVGIDRCRWPRPNADGRCRYCGWPLRWITSNTHAEGHFRHRRLRSYPHLVAHKLTLSEVTSTKGVDARSPWLRHNPRLRNIPTTYEAWAVWKAAHRAAR